MPYEYRKLTDAERKEVLHQRRERGYPLHAPPHPFRQAGCYLITAAIFEHMPIMASPEHCTDFEAQLLEALRGISDDIAGWVILPNHYHALLSVGHLDQVSRTLQHLHGVTSREWNQVDGLTGKRRVWYKFSDRLIRSEQHFYQALNYIHVNPVKHGYVEKPNDWPWSSLHSYYESHGREWLRDHWRTNPPGEFGKGWDD